MAAAAKDDAFENQVTAGSIETERLLIEKGISPKDAREMSTYRVFGGMNGNYGTGITGMVEAGDRWDNEKELADTYLNNREPIMAVKKTGKPSDNSLSKRH